MTNWQNKINVLNIHGEQILSVEVDRCLWKTFTQPLRGRGSKWMTREREREREREKE